MTLRAWQKIVSELGCYTKSKNLKNSLFKKKNCFMFIGFGFFCASITKLFLILSNDNISVFQ